MTDKRTENVDAIKGKDDTQNNDLTPPFFKFRGDELASFFRHRSQFLELMQSYASRNGMAIDKNKIFGIFYDTIFFVSICSLRGIAPAMKDVYLGLDESRSSSLRHVEYLEAIGVFKRQPDPDDNRRTSILLTSDFANDFSDFIQKGIGKRRKDLWQL